MKPRRMPYLYTALLTGVLFCSSEALAFTSGSTGVDGALNPTVNTEIQLPDDGKLNYTTISVPSGVTVTFKKNTANTPAYILATGNVTITGAINVNGVDAASLTPGKGGVGGFDGGLGGTANAQGGKGIGPGGGSPGAVSTNASYYSSGGGGGGFGSAGTKGAGDATYAPGGANGPSYGNAGLQPMIGGSGGGAGAGSANSSGYSNTGGGGGGGGGAILIASSGTVNVGGSLTANGGKGGNQGGGYAGGGGGGAGGSIRIIATTITGNGTISATGGTAGTGNYSGGAGGDGRIRLEAESNARTAATSPGYTFDYPVSVFLTSAPSVNITSIGGTAVPTAATGSYSTPDIVLPPSVTGPLDIVLSASNIPIGNTVTVTVVPETGASTTTTALLTGTVASSTATVQATLSTKAVSVVMASVTFTVQALLGDLPVYAGGEKVLKMRVASVLGGRSTVTYITETGREIPSEM